MDLGKINILYVIGTIIIADLPSSPIDAFNLDNLAIPDLAAERNCSSVNVMDT